MPLVFTLIFYLIYIIILHFTGEVWLSLLVFTIPIGILIMNLVLRKKLKYKSWFINHFNFLLERKQFVSSSEISSELLFEKLVEVITESEFQLFEMNKENLNILCGTAINFLTWGENIYIQLKIENNNSTSIEIVSTTIFGGMSWKRNTKNYSSFIASFENSLTI